MPRRLGKLNEVHRDVYAMICSGDDTIYGGFGANQGFVELENSVLVFDSGFSLLQARNLDRAINRTTDKKVKYLINSHDHSDHVFGNSFFWKKYSSRGLNIISHQICKDKLGRVGKRRLASYLKIPDLRQNLNSIEIREPDLTYSDLGFRMNVEGTEFLISHPPTGAHTLGDSVMYLPKAGVAFMGDLFWNRFLPNLEDANMEGWLSYLEEIDSETYQKFVPGHGEVSSYNRVREFIEYLRTVRANLLKVKPSNISDRDELRSCFSVPGSEDWKLKLIADYNVEALFFRKSGSQMLQF